MRADPAPASSRSLRTALPWYAGLLLLVALAWSATLAWAGPMGAGQGTMGLSLVAFLPVWVVMMAAMMFPSVAPMAFLWIRTVAARPTVPGRVVGVASFLGGYLMAWLAFGVVVYAALAGVDRLVLDDPGHGRWIGAAVFAAAGAYQLTGLKEACLSHCRTPVGALFAYAGFRGRARDLRVGLHHGSYCVGCCWGLMIVLVALGAMNVPVMVALTGVVLLEKCWRHGPAFSRVFSVALLVMAVLAPVVPALLPGVSPGPMPM